MTHTKGPWEADGFHIWATSPWNARFKVATVSFPSPMNGIDGEANAKLLAASPTMLEALETTRGNIVSLRNAGLPGPLEEWLRIVEETIALATT